MLNTLPNIGKELSVRLEHAGIRTPDQLRERGSRDIFKTLFVEDPENVCINMLYALEGAVQGIRWHHLSPEIKNELKEFYRQFPS